MESAVNANPDVPGFIRKFKPTFPVGTSGGQESLDYLQWPKDQRPLVPLMMFIDRKGMVRAQYSGLDEKFFDAQQDQHIREQAEKLLAEKADPAKARPKRLAK